MVLYRFLFAFFNDHIYIYPENWNTMSESRKRSNERISLSEENTESPADDGINVDKNDDNVVIEVGIEDNQHGYHDDNNNGDNEDAAAAADDDDDDDEGEDDSNEDEDFEGDHHGYHDENINGEHEDDDDDEGEDDSDEDDENFEGDQHGYNDDTNHDYIKFDDNEEGERECDYEYDSDEDVEEDSEDDEEEQDRVIDDHPLRIAMRRNESRKIIFPLIKAYMKTVQQEQNDDNCGDFLLHLACSNCRPSVVIKLIELFPKSVLQKDDNGDYPLHIACCHQPDAIVMKIIELFPMAAQLQNGDSYYPLHLLCINGRSEQVLMKFLAIFPKAATHNVLTRSAMVKQKGNTGCALHMACRYVLSIDVIRKLIRINRMALSEKDCKGNYPLHCALYGEQSNDVITLLIDVDPLAILRLNNKGESPFHTAYRFTNETFIEVMIEEDDTLVNMRNRYGKTLLHYAASYWDDDFGCKDDIIELLLQHRCIDVNAKDNNNNAPLHLASMSRSSIIFRKLLNHQFIIIDHKNNENKTPLEILKEKRRKFEEHINSDMNNSSAMEEYLNDQLSQCSETIILLEELLTKQRWNAYLYHCSTIVDL